MYKNLRLLQLCTPALLFFYAAWFFLPYLRTGLPLFFDAHSHIARSWFAMELFKQGNYPNWSNYWYGGYRFSEFYGPLYYWLNGILGAITGDLVFSTKIFLWIAQILCAIGAFFFLRSLRLSSIISLLGSVLYLQTPIFHWILGTIGNYPSVVILVCIPIALRASLRHYSQRDLSKVIATRMTFASCYALILSIALSSHLYNAAMSSLGIVVFQLGVIAEKGSPPSVIKEKLKTFLASYLFSCLLTIHVWLPFVIDIDKVSLKLAAIDPPHPDLSLTPVMRIAGLEPYRWEYVFLKSHGTLLVAMAALACLLSIFDKFKHLRPSALAFLAILTFVTVISDRCVLILPIFLVALICLFIEHIIQLTTHRVTSKIMWFSALALLATISFSGSIFGTRPTPRYQDANTLKDYAEINSINYPGEHTSRTFDLTKTSISIEGFYGWSSFSPAYSGKGIPFGAFPQASSLGTNITMAMLSVWVPLTNQKSLEISKYQLDAAIDALFLSDVGFLVKRDTDTAFQKLEVSGYGSAISNHIFKLTRSTPIIFSSNAQPLEANSTLRSDLQNPLLRLLQQLWITDPLQKTVVVDSSMRPVARTKRKQDWKELLPYVKRMNINREKLTAETFFTSDQEIHCSTITQSVLPEFKLYDFTESITSVSIEAEANMNGCARLSYAYDPQLRVSLDGRLVEHYEDALGQAVIVKFPIGRHRVTIEAPSDYLRKALTAFSATLSIALAILLLRSKLKTRSCSNR